MQIKFIFQYGENNNDVYDYFKIAFDKVLGHKMFYVAILGIGFGIMGGN